MVLIQSSFKGFYALIKSRQSDILLSENYRFVILGTLSMFRHTYLKQGSGECNESSQALINAVMLSLCAL